MDQKSRVLVIVVVYNGMQWLQRCCDSVIKSSIPLDLYIVDNGSTDGSQEFIDNNYPAAIFVRSDKNLGFGAANNFGIQYAIDKGYDYIYLLNQDAWVAEDAIAQMVESHKRMPQYGILSPMQMYPDGKTMESGFARSLNRCITPKNNLECEVVRVKFAMAAHWLISRDCFAKVGLFSPVFYHYGEDNNYIHRVNYFGFLVGVVTRAIAVHDREQRPTPLDKQVYLVKNSYLKHSANINYPFCLMRLYARFIICRDARRLARRSGDGAIYAQIVETRFPVEEIRMDRKRNKRPYLEEV